MMLGKCLLLFYVFFKVGLFSFGGGYAMLPMIYQEIEQFGFMPPREFSDIVALSQMTPGPVAVNAATYVGEKTAGFWGAVFATVGVALPSLILIVIVSAFLNRFKTSQAVQAVLAGIRPATVGLIASAVLFFANTSIFTNKLSLAFFRNPLHFLNLPALAICGLTILATQKWKMDPILLTVFAGVLGAFIL
ncbi:chromate transporter [Hydrogenispora ethanolica]|uniref:Chromate transporter n=2 Tax=Hydrogenispora ethanolica TaxID=1082276 RepID=A0A4R1QU23_HYDET|nr:chromate transporter [Hydrogenispora ethanolica]